MNSLLYYIVYGILYAVSLLPFRVLYWISDGLYLLIFYVTGYRKSIVMDNLAHAFPDKSPEERLAIAKEFYRNFVDSFLETLKMISAGDNTIRQRFQIDNPEAFNQFYEQGRRCQLCLGHVFNWELGGLAASFVTPYPVLIVYMPIRNQIFERLLKKVRTRTGANLLPATDMRRSMIPYREMRYLLALVADQAPGNPASAYWLPFFGRPTAMIQGPEKGARAGNVPTVFAEVYKPRRGYYRARLEVGADEPAGLPEGELTRRYTEFLEKSITRNPSLWLWSHRRWKHEWKAEYRESWIGSGPPPAGQTG